MPIRSLGNPLVRYNAVMSKTGDGAEPVPWSVASCNPSQTGSWYGDTAVYGGGFASNQNTQGMEYLNLDYTSNTADFGDMVQSTRARATGSNGSRGLLMGGRQGTEDVAVEYITFATPGNGTDFGDLVSPLNGGYASGASDGTRAFAIGGNCCGAGEDNIQYFTITSTGNGTSFGNMAGTRYGQGSANNATRAVIGGSKGSGADQDSIEYITMGTSGSGSNFGDLTMDRAYTGAGAVADRAIWAGNGGDTEANAVTGIDYVTITSTGNASDFGDMTVARTQLGSNLPGNATRVAIAGGKNTSGNWVTTIDYVVVGTTGNASEFGDLATGMTFYSGTSGC